jgi:hypothetical protein
VWLGLEGLEGVCLGLGEVSGILARVWRSSARGLRKSGVQRNHMRGQEGQRDQVMKNLDGTVMEELLRD